MEERDRAGRWTSSMKKAATESRTGQPHWRLSLSLQAGSLHEHFAPICDPPPRLWRKRGQAVLAHRPVLDRASCRCPCRTAENRVGAQGGSSLPPAAVWHADPCSRETARRLRHGPPRDRTAVSSASRQALVRVSARRLCRGLTRRLHLRRLPLRGGCASVLSEHKKAI